MCMYIHILSIIHCTLFFPACVDGLSYLGLFRICASLVVQDNDGAPWQGMTLFHLRLKEFVLRWWAFSTTYGYKCIHTYFVMYVCIYIYIFILYVPIHMMSFQPNLESMMISKEFP